MNLNETIAAISTPVGEGGIGIIRISGPGSLGVANLVFRPVGKKSMLAAQSGSESGFKPEERRLYYGRIIDAKANVIDNGFFVFMKAPVSYTGLDTVELHCHGGPLVLREVMAAVLSAGARLAGPGEFTRLAFMNGKLDLSQAEAVIDVIRAETGAALASARGRLEGAFSAKVREIRDCFIDLLAGVEAALDFPEDELPNNKGLVSGLENVEGRLNKLVDTFEEGRCLRDGVATLILGRPNVGKSSLLNILLQEERAIVTPVPGTTRDVIEESVNIRGVPIRLIDTAGLRETLDPIEAIGVRLARERIEHADLILFVIDASALHHEDVELLELAAGKKLVVVANKSDLADADMRKAATETLGSHKLVFISAKTTDGIAALEDAIYEQAVGRPFGALSHSALGELTVSMRHRDALIKAAQSAGRAIAGLEPDANIPMECVATDIRDGLTALGEITGETTTEDILDRIFERFCIGK